MLRMFDFQCRDCGQTVERMVRTWDQGKRCETVSCECGGKLKKMPVLFRVNMGPVPLVGYWDDNLETYIRTNNHRKQVMREKGVCEKGATPIPGATA